MKEWKANSKTSEDIVHTIKKVAADYTPEWNFMPEKPDIGAALAFAYADMLGETLEQLNRAGYKNQLAFFNSLGAEQKSAEKAKGYAVFRLATDAPEGTEVPAYTKLTAELSDGEGSVQFETKTDMYATLASPSCFYMTHGEKDAIYCLTDDVTAKSEPIVLFEEKGENLQSHTMYLTHEEVFHIEGSAALELSFYARSGKMIDEKLLQAFTDGETVQFSYWTKKGWENFESVTLLGGRVVLHKRAEQPPFAKKEMGEVETFVIRCQVQNIFPLSKLTVEKILIQSRGERIAPQIIYGADVECNQKEYFPFGEQIGLFGEVYFGSDEVFSKRGAEVTLNLQMDFARIPLEQNPEETSIEWKWIMKQSEFKPSPEYDITIEEVIWEYFNGNGWSRLFAGHEYEKFFTPSRDTLSQQKTMTFLCPADMTPVLVNSCETCYIRARIIKVNNLYKMTGNYITPVLGNTSFSYQYSEKSREPEQIWLKNNLEEVRCSGQEFREEREHREIFTTVDKKEKALYLGFELPPIGAPVCMLWQMENRLPGQRDSLMWEYYNSSGWQELNLADETRNFTRTGLVTFVGHQDFTQKQLFGKNMYWIRIWDENSFYSNGHEQKYYPVLKNLWMNAVEIAHMDREETEVFTLDYYKEDCVFTLMQGNINEIKVEILRENSERTSWEVWKEVKDLQTESGTGKVYQIDRIAGVVRFGDGIHGQVPPYGKEGAIRIHYKCAGGSRANVEVGAINKLNETVGFVTEVYNPESIWGGLDEESPKEAIRRSAALLRHRSRAITARDYEELALEASRTIWKVKCFGGRNEQGEKEAGAVTLVVLPEHYIENQNIFHSVQETVYQYLAPRMDTGIFKRKQFYVVEPKMVEVQVKVELTVKSFQDIFKVRRAVQEKIRLFLDPMKGHFDGKGWEIGQLPNAMQIQNALKEIPEIQWIQKIYFMTYINGIKGRQEMELNEIRKHPYILPMSGNHEVIVTVHE